MALFLFVQVPAFWQGDSISQGALEILQVKPIWNELLHVGGAKLEDGETKIKEKKNNQFKNKTTVTNS
jgi:hypothetical protein